VCCSVLQCVAVLQRVAAAASVRASEARFQYKSQCNPVCCSVLQCVAECYSRSFRGGV